MYEHDDTISFKNILDEMMHEMLGKDFKSDIFFNSVSVDTKNMSAEQTLSYYFYAVDKWIHEYKTTLEYNDYCGVYLQFDNETKIMLNSGTQNCYAEYSEKFDIFQNIILEKIDTELNFLQKKSFFKFMNEILKRKYDLTYKNFKKIKIEDMSVEYKTIVSAIKHISQGNTVIPENIETTHVSDRIVYIKYKNEILFQILLDDNISDNCLKILDKENNQTYIVQTKKIESTKNYIVLVTKITVL